MSRRAPRPVASAVQRLTAELEPSTTLAKVQRVWPSAVGEQLAGAGRPVAERDGVLTVSCSDAVWSAELEMIGSQLVKQLNDALGGPLIGRLRCRTS